MRGAGWIVFDLFSMEMKMIVMWNSRVKEKERDRGCAAGGSGV